MGAAVLGSGDQRAASVLSERTASDEARKESAAKAAAFGAVEYAASCCARKAVTSWPAADAVSKSSERSSERPGSTAPGEPAQPVLASPGCATHCGTFAGANVAGSSELTAALPACALECERLRESLRRALLRSARARGAMPLGEAHAEGAIPGAMCCAAGLICAAAAEAAVVVVAIAIAA
mmetsp:Transcript_5116/g.13736  ORF Transcript_5116/g.13736 Transcript_5116/m.13736 type:complete len:181 (-) Transcript_5116:1308-1850(-)